MNDLFNADNVFDDVDDDYGVVDMVIRTTKGVILSSASRQYSSRL